MNELTVDVRSATCPGGGGIWAFLSHVREVPLGGTLRVLTDDEIAVTDIPAWTSRVGWDVTTEEIAGGRSIAATRPL